MHFAPTATRFHIRQDLLQSAYVAGELLHRAQPLMHLFESVADELERFAQPSFSNVPCNFSSTVARIFSICCVFSSRNSFSRESTLSVNRRAWPVT